MSEREIDDEKTQRFVPEAIGDEIEGSNVVPIMDDPRMIEKLKNQKMRQMIA